MNNLLMQSDHVRELMLHRADVCVSITLPVYPAHVEQWEADRLRLRALAAEAQANIAELAPEWRVPDIQELFAPVTTLLQGGADFWRQPGAGVALFLAPQQCVVERLPLPLPEQVVVGPRFHVKAILPLFSDQGRYYVLAFCQSKARLFRATRYSLEEVEVPGMPEGLEEVLIYDQFEKQLQYRTATAAPTGHGRAPAAYYSHDTVRSRKKEELLRYCQAIDAALRPVLRRKRDPLVLACVSYLFPLFQQANRYTFLYPEYVPGSPARCELHTLRERAWDVVAPHFSAARWAAAEEFLDLAGTPLAAADVEAVARMAQAGRVETLFVAADEARWGKFDEATGQFRQHARWHAGDEDLLDRSATEAFLKGGTVYVVPRAEVPGDSPVAAILRY